MAGFKAGMCWMHEMVWTWGSDNVCEDDWPWPVGASVLTSGTSDTYIISGTCSPSVVHRSSIAVAFRSDTCSTRLQDHVATLSYICDSIVHTEPLPTARFDTASR